jgi:hypothetical protein
MAKYIKRTVKKRIDTKISPKKLHKILEQEELFMEGLDSKSSDYVYNSGNLYSQKFLEIFRKTLGSPSDFLNSDTEERGLINEQVKDVFLVDNHYKFLLKKMENDPSKLLSILKPQFKRFKISYNETLYMESPKNNVNRKYLVQRLSKFTSNLLKYFLKNNSEIFSDRDVAYIGLGTIKAIIRAISPEQIFQVICASSLKLSYKSLVNDNIPQGSIENILGCEEEDFQETHLKVIRHELHAHFEKKLLKLIVSEVVIKIHEKYTEDVEGWSDDYLKNKLTLVHRFLNSKGMLLEMEEFYEDLVGSTHIILDIFVHNTAKKVETEYVRKKKSNEFLNNTIISLPSGLDALLSFSDHLPQILEPDDWDSEGMFDEYSLAKRIHFGCSEISYDPETIKAINYTQKKKFKINMRFVKLLEEVDRLSLSEADKIKLPFKNQAQMRHSENSLRDLRKDLNLNYYTLKMVRYILDREREFYLGKYQKFVKGKVWEEISNICGISAFDTLRYKTYLDKVLEFRSNVHKKQIFSTKVTMAKLYTGFPLYFTNVMDYRGRMYTLSYLFSRTTGFYKYMVEDFEKIKLTRRGMIWFLRAYYSPGESKLKDFDLFCEGPSSETLEQLYGYFEEIKLTPKEKSANFFYFSLIEEEIRILPSEGFKTGFMIEIDQKSSFSTFISLILKNTKMARYSNLLGGPSLDIYLYTQSYIKDFFLDKGITSKTLLDAFLSIRKLTKSPFMFLIYGQGAIGRYDDWLAIFKDNSIKLSSEDEAQLLSFSKNYLSFLSLCFPKFEEQFNALTDIYQFINEKSQTTSIRSLDGSIINWSFYFEMSHTGSRYNPIRDRNENYHRVIPFNQKHLNTITEKLTKESNGLLELADLTDDQIKTLKKNARTLKRYEQSCKNIISRKKAAFRPGFVHSIDGAVIRLLILAMKEKHNYDINHLHDSIQVHPNHVDNLYEEIYLIYKDLADENLSDYFVKQSYSLIVGKDTREFELLVAKMANLQEDFGGLIENMIPENMYPLEN